MKAKPSSLLRSARANGGSVLLEGALAFPLLLFLFAAMQWGGDILLARVKLIIAERQACGMAASRLSLRSLDLPNKKSNILQTLNSQYFSGKTSEGSGRGSSQNLRQDADLIRTTRNDYVWYGLGLSRLHLDYKIPLWLQGMLTIPNLFWNQGGGGAAFTVDRNATWTIHSRDNLPPTTPAALGYGRSEYGSLKLHPRNWRAGDVCGRPMVINFLKYLIPGNHFETWDNYVQREIFANSTWVTAVSIGATGNPSDPYPIQQASPANVQAYKRFNSFENWSE